MLTDAQVYCMTFMIYLFRPPLIAKAICRKTAEAKLYLIFQVYLYCTLLKIVILHLYIIHVINFVNNII